jgi:Lrp/AsnC family transcriptional regulator for asnA, asnC and gidA
MDKRNEYILKALLKNSRISLSKVALELGISETAVRKRIKRLEIIGAIKGYTTIIDPFYLGYEGVALVGVDTSPESLLRVFQTINSQEEVRYGALSSGDHMMMFEVWCKTSKELNTFLQNIKKTKGVTRVCPAILLKRVESG